MMQVHCMTMCEGIQLHHPDGVVEISRSCSPNLLDSHFSTSAGLNIRIRFLICSNFLILSIGLKWTPT